MSHTPYRARQLFVIVARRRSNTVNYRHKLTGANQTEFISSKTKGDEAEVLVLHAYGCADTASNRQSKEIKTSSNECAMRASMRYASPVENISR